MDKRFQVFVSSTYADLHEERQKVIQTLMEMDCIPAGMELFPATDEEQWEFIKRIIDDCDYYILMIGGRYGTLTSEGISYTEKEYDYAISKGLRVLAFIHENPEEIPLGKSDTDPALREKLEKFRAKVAENRLVKMWSAASQLPGLIALSLSKTMKVYPAVGWVRASHVASGELLAELNDLRKENAQLKSAITEVETRVGQEESELASLDDSFSVLLEWTEYKYQTRFPRKLQASFTWGEIFACLAPELEEYPNNDAVNKKLGSALYRKKKPNATIAVRVQHDIFQTIRVQLRALRLIDTSYRKTTKGSMALFWSLTKRGQQLMTQLRTVRALADESVAKTTWSSLERPGIRQRNGPNSEASNCL